MAVYMGVGVLFWGLGDPGNWSLASNYTRMAWKWAMGEMGQTFLDGMMRNEHDGYVDNLSHTRRQNSGAHLESD
ncbi:hypothetical protein B0T16DRAFT_406567, partial [Cercophora newfieldiana]